MAPVPSRLRGRNLVRENINLDLFSNPAVHIPVASDDRATADSGNLHVGPLPGHTAQFSSGTFDQGAAFFCRTKLDLVRGVEFVA